MDLTNTLLIFDQKKKILTFFKSKNCKILTQNLNFDLNEPNFDKKNKILTFFI